jgi:hypothetical protein
MFNQQETWNTYGGEYKTDSGWSGGHCTDSDWSETEKKKFESGKVENMKK